MNAYHPPDPPPGTKSGGGGSWLLVAACVACAAISVVVAVVLSRRGGGGDSGDVTDVAASLAFVPEEYRGEYEAVRGSDGRVYALFRDEKDKMGVLTALERYVFVMNTKILPRYSGTGADRLRKLFGNEALSCVHQYRERPDFAAFAYTAGDFSFLNIDTSERGGVRGVGGDAAWWDWVFWYSLHEAAHMALAPKLKHDLEMYAIWGTLLRIARDVGVYGHGEQPRQPPETWRSDAKWSEWSANYNQFTASDEAWVKKNLPNIEDEWFGEGAPYPQGDPRR